MIDKKAYVFKVLDLFKDSLPIAKWLRVFLQYAEIDDKILDLLIQTFEESTKDAKNISLKSKLQKGKKVFEKIKKTEQESRRIDEEWIASLEKMLSQM